MKPERYDAVNFFRNIRGKSCYVGAVELYLSMTRYGHKMIFEKQSRAFDAENELELISCLTQEIIRQRDYPAEKQLEILVSLVLSSAVRTAVLRDYIESMAIKPGENLPNTEAPGDEDVAV